MGCEVCRYKCKDIEENCKKIFPKENFLGNSIHFKEDPTKAYGKHESTSRICVACKDYFHYGKIAWKKLKKGLYSFCPECASRNDYIVQNVPAV